MGKKKFLIITGYFKDESHGLLGPQMAATLINDHTDYESRVVAVTREDDKEELNAALESYFQGLAGWIRRIEEKIEFQRISTTIGWWRTKRVL